MASRIELEASYHLGENYEDILEKIKEQNFKLVEDSVEEDTYFTDKNLEFVKSRTCLRTRKTNEDFIELTYKPKTDNNTEKYGKLYIDRILFESNFPIIFTCKNDADEIFICVCCQNNIKGCKWLVGKTDAINIIRMLKDELTLRELVRGYSSGRISVDYIDGEYRVEYNNSDWNEDSIYLPKEDSYMFADEGEFADDISYYSTLIKVCYDENYYKNISKKLETINQGFESITDKFNESVSLFGNISISSKVVSTLNVAGTLSVNTEEYKNQRYYKVTSDSCFDTLLNDNISIEVDFNDCSFIDAA